MSRMSLAVERASSRPAPGLAEMAIARLAQADRAIAEAIEVADAVQLVGTAKALREWASAVHAGRDHERQAAIFVLRAVRNAGERIAEAQARGEVATQGSGRPGSVVSGDTYSPATLAEIGVTRDESSEWKRLAALYPDDGSLERAAEAMPSPSLSGAIRLAPLMSSATDDWWTPAPVVEAAAAALGGAIDLDPCSNDGAPNVPAAAHYTAADDGLARPWRGSVYMNPPYSRADEFAAKLAEEFAYGNVTSAVALVPARVDTRWFGSLSSADLCFVRGRLRFLLPSGEPARGGAPFPSMAAYLGPDPARFAAAFAPLGPVYRRVDA